MYKRIAGFILFLALQPLTASAQEFVCLETNLGDICMRLLPEAAPNTVNNFLGYVERGAYDGTLIHRLVRSGGLNVIQGGGFSGLPGNFGAAIASDPPILLEQQRSNLRGTVAMARLGGQANSATNQWFINFEDNTFLDNTFDGGYAVFAEIVQGMEVVDMISAYPIRDFSFALGDQAFREVPVDMLPEETLAFFEDFVLVSRAWATDRLPNTLLPYQCSPDSPGDTLTEFCGSSLRFPVQIDGLLFEATLVFVPSTEGLIFSVQRESLQLLADTGQERAHYAAGELLIPSVRTPAGAFVNVSLLLQDLPSLKFALNTFSPR
jgi:peptidyl-prolyl cis-trans isomerase A (cyclophilin A)